MRIKATKKRNKEIAKTFYEIASYLEMEEAQFKPQAYEKAGDSLAVLEKDVKEIYEQEGLKGLKQIAGVGESLALKIEEYLKTGKIKYYQKLKKKIPVNLDEIIGVEGMGPKRAKILYEKLDIKTLKDLEKAAKAGKIASLFGFGEKTEKNILEGIVFLKRSKGRFLLGEILPVAREIEEQLKSLKQVNRILAVGSVRRRKETIGDLDFLVTLKKTKYAQIAADKVMDFFTSLPGIAKIWRKGPVLSSVRMEHGFDPHTKFGVGVDVDLRVFNEQSFGAAAQYFTGSVEHNIITRKIAMNKGLKLNEYGLFRGDKKIAGKTEKEIYKKLGMDWPAPEIRENQGEIEAALKRKLPKLVEYNDIKGDLHCHSNWNGGVHSIKQMAEMAQKLGYEYLGISDHTKFLRIENGLDEKQLAEQRKEIDKLNKKFQVSGFRFQVFQGAETNILNDGTIDIKNSALKKLDYAIAGIHSSMKMEKSKMTERIIRAMKNPNIDIISHPTGRILKRRDEYQVDFDRILRAAKEFNVILEINAFPVRLDLSDKNIRLAKQAGVKMVINTDSHHKEHLRFMELGVSQARRGWAEKKDIINTRPLDKLLKFFK